MRRMSTLSNLRGGYWDDPTCESAARVFAEGRDLTIVRRLGAGVDGVVFKTDEDSAVKVARTLPLHEREVEVYFRLMEWEIDFVEGFSVPRMLFADAEYRAIEMSIVRPPYCLDFATVTLDSPPDWDEERAAAFDESLDEFFGPQADRVRSVIASSSASACT